MSERSNPQRYAVFDIDACISDDRHRLHLLPSQEQINSVDYSDPDISLGLYRVYHEACTQDPVMNSMLVGYHAERGHTIHFLTARPIYMLEETTEWLERNLGKELGDAPWMLSMRSYHDTRHSADLKPAALIKAQIAHNVVAAYDDREDVIEAYRLAGIRGAKRLSYHSRMKDIILATAGRTTDPAPTVGEILNGMAETYTERNAVYGDNYRMVGAMMKVLFPDGVSKELLHSDKFHLFELKLVKLSRYAISDMTHRDSIHDDAVYSAMLESINLEEQTP
jgi:hypothetical protein